MSDYTLRQVGRCLSVDLFRDKEFRGDAEFIDGLNEAADVVAQHLRVDLILHSRLGLTADMTAELGLYHPDGGFNVRTLVIVLVEFLPVQVPEVEGVLPDAATGTIMATLERDERPSTRIGDSLMVIDDPVGFIRRDLADIEVLARHVEQRPQLDGIT